MRERKAVKENGLVDAADKFDDMYQRMEALASHAHDLIKHAGDEKLVSDWWENMQGALEKMQSVSGEIRQPSLPGLEPTEATEQDTDHAQVQEEDTMTDIEETISRLAKLAGLGEAGDHKPDADGDGIPDWADKEPHKAGDDDDRVMEGTCPHCHEDPCACEEVNEGPRALKQASRDWALNKNSANKYQPSKSYRPSWEKSKADQGKESDELTKQYLARGGKITKESDEEAAKNPYAVGMAQAMKSTGDEPPLKKSTINKAHEIAKAVDKNESIEEAGDQKNIIGSKWFRDYHEIPSASKSGVWTEVNPEDYGFEYTGGNVGGGMQYLGLKSVAEPSKGQIKQWLDARARGLQNYGYTRVQGESLEESTQVDECGMPMVAGGMPELTMHDLDGSTPEQKDMFHLNVKTPTKTMTFVTDNPEEIIKVLQASGVSVEGTTTAPAGDQYTPPQRPPMPTQADMNKSDGASQKSPSMTPVAPAKEEPKEEAAKPDYVDLDKDGDTDESMKKAADDKEEDDEMKESIATLRKLSGYSVVDEGKFGNSVAGPAGDPKVVGNTIDFAMSGTGNGKSGRGDKGLSTVGDNPLGRNDRDLTEDKMMAEFNTWLKEQQESK